MTQSGSESTIVKNVEGGFGAKDSALIHPTQAQFLTLRKDNDHFATSEKNVFVSYSHTDIEWLKRFQVHLKPLEREGAVELWSDEKIQPGSEWREEIRDAIKKARVAVLLIRADFLASDFIYYVKG